MLGHGSEGFPLETDTASAAANARLTLPGQGKVKFFGAELPPKCALRECWLTDDGQSFYCTDFTCNRHKYRRTKHDKYSRYAHLDPERAHRRPESLPIEGRIEGRLEGRAATGGPAEEQGTWPLVPFRCPRCASADIQMRLLQNRYECQSCAYFWR